MGNINRAFQPLLHKHSWFIVLYKKLNWIWFKPYFILSEPFWSQARHLILMSPLHNRAQSSKYNEVILDLEYAKRYDYILYNWS